MKLQGAIESLKVCSCRPDYKFSRNKARLQNNLLTSSNVKFGGKLNERSKLNEEAKLIALTNILIVCCRINNGPTLLTHDSRDPSPFSLLNHVTHDPQIILFIRIMQLMPYISFAS